MTLFEKRFFEPFKLRHLAVAIGRNCTIFNLSLIIFTALHRLIWPRYGMIVLLVYTVYTRSVHNRISALCVHGNVSDDIVRLLQSCSLEYRCDFAGEVCWTSVRTIRNSYC